jgi:hypothetical protein
MKSPKRGGKDGQTEMTKLYTRFCFATRVKKDGKAIIKISKVI